MFLKNSITYLLFTLIVIKLLLVHNPNKQINKTIELLNKTVPLMIMQNCSTIVSTYSPQFEILN